MKSILSELEFHSIVQVHIKQQTISLTIDVEAQQHMYVMIIIGPQWVKWIGVRTPGVTTAWP